MSERASTKGLEIIRLSRDDVKILAYLHRIAQSDAAKGGVGTRDSVEIALYLGWSGTKTRKVLRYLAQRDLVDEFEVDGSGIPWRIAAKGIDAYQRADALPTPSNPLSEGRERS